MYKPKHHLYQLSSEPIRGLSGVLIIDATNIELNLWGFGGAKLF